MIDNGDDRINDEVSVEDFAREALTALSRLPVKESKAETETYVRYLIHEARVSELRLSGNLI